MSTSTLYHAQGIIGHTFERVFYGENSPSGALGFVFPSRKVTAQKKVKTAPKVGGYNGVSSFTAIQDWEERTLRTKMPVKKQLPIQREKYKSSFEPRSTFESSYRRLVRVLQTYTTFA